MSLRITIRLDVYEEQTGGVRSVATSKDADPEAKHQSIGAVTELTSFSLHSLADRVRRAKSTDQQVEMLARGLMASDAAREVVLAELRRLIVDNGGYGPAKLHGYGCTCAGCILGRPDLLGKELP